MANAVENNMVSVNFRWLLTFYAILPLCALAILIDQVALAGSLQSTLPHSPQKLLLFAIFFGLPHIIASNTILASHQDYRQHFRRHFLIASGLIITYLVMARTVFSYDLAYFSYAAITILHVLKQQFGLTRAAAGLGGRHFQLWMWSGILAGVFLYTAVFMFKRLDSEQLLALKLLSGVCTAFYLVQGILLHKQARPGIGRLYLWGNNLLVPLSLLFYLLDYSFFTILCPRIVHDCTAFAIYSAHDHNRVAMGASNKLQRTIQKMRIPAALNLLLISIAIAFVIRWEAQDLLVLLGFGLLTGQQALLLVTLVKTYLEMMHYYMEAITWKAGSPYRKFLRFSFN